MPPTSPRRRRPLSESVKPQIDAAPHELTVTLPPPGTVLVLGDSVRLAQVMENLPLGNTTKYTEDGRIWLSIAATESTMVRDTGMQFASSSTSSTCSPRPRPASTVPRVGWASGLPLVRSLVQYGRGSGPDAGPGPGHRGRGHPARLRRGRLQTSDSEAPAPPPVTTRRILVQDEANSSASSGQDPHHPRPPGTRRARRRRGPRPRRQPGGRVSRPRTAAHERLRSRPTGSAPHSAHVSR